MECVFPLLVRQLNKKNRKDELLGIEISGIAISKGTQLFCKTHCSGDNNAQVPGSGNGASPAMHVQFCEDAGGVALHRTK